MKKMMIVALMNQSLDEREQYRVMAISQGLLTESKQMKGSDEMKELLRKQITELFNGDVLDYFKNNRVPVTDDDVNNCINELAIGHASNIAGEDFWWSYPEELITSISKPTEIVVCDECGSADIEVKWWVNPNTMELISDCEDDECWCPHCEKHTRTDVVKAEDYKPVEE